MAHASLCSEQDRWYVYAAGSTFLLVASPVSSQDISYEQFAVFEVGPINDLVVLNNSQLVTGSDEGLWLLDSDKQTFFSSDLPVIQVVASRLTREVVAVYSDYTLGLWDFEQGAEIATITCALFVDHYLLTGSADYTARLWDVAARQEIAVMTHTGPVTAVSMGVNGYDLIAASGSVDGTVQLWLPQFAYALGTLNIGEPVTSLDVHYDQGDLVVGTATGKLHHWTIVTRILFDYAGEQLQLYEVPLESGTQELALYKPGRRSSTFIDPVNPAAELVEWEGNWRTLTPVLPLITDSTELAVLDAHSSAILHIFDFGDGIISVDSDHRAVAWDLSTPLTELAAVQLEADVINDQIDPSYAVLEFRLAAANADHSISLWTSQDGAEIARVIGHATVPTHVIGAPRTSGILITADAGGSVRIWAPRY